MILDRLCERSLLLDSIPDSSSLPSSSISYELFPILQDRLPIISSSLIRPFSRTERLRLYQVREKVRRADSLHNRVAWPDTSATMSLKLVLLESSRQVAKVPLKEVVFQRIKRPPRSCHRKENGSNKMKAAKSSVQQVLAS